MSCKDCLSRRAFLANSALAAAAVLAQGCGNGVFGPPLPTEPTNGNMPAGGPFTIRVADFPALATPGALVDIGHARAVMRADTSSFIALSMICTHQQCVVAILDNAFVCPCHGSEFGADGGVTHGPATLPLVQLQATYDAAAGTLTVS